MDDELARAVDDLADAVADLGEALDASSGPRLRVPRPADVLRSTDEVAIPTLIAVLEAQIRMLRLLQRGTRLLRYDRAIRGRSTHGGSNRRIDESDDPEQLISQLGRTLDRLGDRVETDEDDRVERALSRSRSIYDDLERALLGESPSDRDGPIDERMPQNPPRTSIGTEIEIDDGADSRDDPSSDGTGAGEEPGDAGVDVDAELETLRDRYGSDEDEPAGTGTDADDASGAETTAGREAAAGDPADADDETGGNDPAASDDGAARGDADSDADGGSSD